MPRWKRTETLYTVKIAHHPKRGIQVYLPKPVVEQLGRPDHVTFLVKANGVVLMPPKKAYVTKALEVLEDYIQGKITREEAGRIFIDMATEPIVEDDEVLDDIFTDLVLIDEPEGEGQLTPEEVEDLRIRLKAVLEA